MANKKRLINNRMIYIVVENAKGKSDYDTSTDELLKREYGSFSSLRIIKMY